MLSVLTVHLLGWLSLTPEIVSRVPALFGYTDAFMILSGLGIYYSLCRDYSIYKYFVKRIKRLLIPYMLISFPFYSVIWICCNKDALFVINEISTMSFWVNGNTYGKWYIAISVVLYLLAPILFLTIKDRANKRNSILMTTIILVSWLLFIYVIEHKFPEYYSKVNIGLEKSALFYVEMILGSLINCHDSRNSLFLVLFFVFLNINALIMGGDKDICKRAL